MFDREMYDQNDTEVQACLRCSAAELGKLYTTVKQKLKEYNLYGKKIEGNNEKIFSNMLQFIWLEAVNYLEDKNRSYHDGLRAMGSLALTMNRNIQKRRKDQKKQKRKNDALKHSQLDTAIDVQLPLPAFAAEDLCSINSTPCPQTDTISSKYTSHSRDPLPSPTPEPTEESTEPEGSPELQGYLEQGLSPESEFSSEPEVSPAPEVHPEPPTNDALIEHTLAKLVILVESKKPDAMKLCYQFRDLVPHTAKTRPFCIDLTKWDVFSKKLKDEMKFDIHNDQLKVACDGLCNGASIIHDSSLHALLQLQVRIGKPFIILEIVGR